MAKKKAIPPVLMTPDGEDAVIFNPEYDKPVRIKRTLQNIPRILDEMQKAINAFNGKKN